MRKWMATAALVVLTGMSVAWAQEQPTTPPERPQRPQRPERPAQPGQPGQPGRPGQPGGPGRRMQQQIGLPLPQAIAELGLTESQQKQVDPVLADYNRALTALDTKVRDEQAAIRTAGGADAGTRIAELNTKATADRKALLDQTRGKLTPILTRDQVAKLDRLVGPAGQFDQFVAAVRKLTLTAEQKQKIDDAVKQADGDAKAKTEDAEKVTVYTEARTKIRELLTPEQQTELRRAEQQQMQAAMQARVVAELGLNAEQAKKLADAGAARDQAMQSAQTPEERRAAMEAYRAKLAEFLTPAQMDQLQQMTGGGRGMGPGGRGGEGAPGGAPGTPPNGGRGGRGGRGGAGEGQGGAAPGTEG